MRTLPFAVLLLLCLGAGVHADEAMTAADVTERGRDVSGILDLVLVPHSPAGPDGRSILFLLDVSASLQRSDFPGELAAALERNGRHLAGTRIGIARAGAEKEAWLAPTQEREAVVAAARLACTKANGTFQDVYAELRRVLPVVRKGKGAKEVVLVTLENGDAETELERTAAACARADVRVSVIAREAFLSDAIWAVDPPQGPRGTEFAGADNAFIDLPWGFRFQWGIPNNGVLSGFAMYGLSRMAAATGGTVYLYYPPSGIPHGCCGHQHCSCPFCEGDHRPPGEIYQSQRLRAIAPPVVARTKILKEAVSDPFYGAVLFAWEQASRLGLVYSRPSLERMGGSVQIDPYPYRGWTPLGSTVSFSSEAARAKKLVQSCDEILESLESDLEDAARSGGNERYRALADTTRLMFRVTRLNLLLYVAWCREVGPTLVARRAAAYVPPEVAPFPDDARFRAIGYWNLSLCHGVEPYRWIRMPGGEGIRRELIELTMLWRTFERRWAHTPFVGVARRLCLATYYLVQNPGYVPPGKRRVPDTPAEETTTLPDRPARPARPGSGTSTGPGSGPTTGG